MRWALYNLTSTTGSGGVETSAWRLGRTLAERGHQVTLVAGRSDRPLPPEAEGLTVRTFPYRPRESFPDLGSRAGKFLERLSFARAALPELTAGGHDAVLIFKPYDLGPALWARRRGGFRLGFLSGGLESYPGYTALVRRLDYFAAVSRHLSGRIARASGVEPAVNHLGVDAASFRPVEPDAELAARVGIGPDDQVMVAAVRLVALKGMQRAIAALALLSRDWPRLKLAVAGEGPYRAELERRAAELGVADRVSLLGLLPAERLAGFYALGQVAVFPSMGEEALGLAIAEASACGLPVVASRLGGVPEVVGADAGLLIPPKDDQALAAAVAELLADPQRRRAMGQAGRARVLELFSWRATAQRLEEGLAGETA